MWRNHYVEEPLCGGTTMWRNHYDHDPGTSINRTVFAVPNCPMLVYFVTPEMRKPL